MKLTINIPNPSKPSKNQCLVGISLHFLDSQLVEYTAPSGWDIEEQEPCEDCIRREDALMALTGQCADSPIELLPKAIKRINALPPVTPQESRWIPVSERYPKIEDEYKYFLVTDSKGKVSVQEFFISLDEDPQPYFSGMVDVIAWMPLPEPYKQEVKK